MDAPNWWVNNLGDITRRRAAAATAGPLISFPVAVYITGSRRDKMQLTGAEQRRVRIAAVLSRRGAALLTPKLRQTNHDAIEKPNRITSVCGCTRDECAADPVPAAKI